MAGFVAKNAHKFEWFRDHGYLPHYFQILFHWAWNPDSDKLCRYRHLVAGRRGGKTLSAAWETMYYALNPARLHWDAHRIKSDRPLHIWVLTPDYRSAGRASLFNIRNVLRDAGFRHGKEFHENRGEKIIEFENGTILEFKTAERPEQLVGAGLDLMWVDEAAVIPNDDAWLIARPALSDKQGVVIGTTTPRGKNWYYDLFWNDIAKANPAISSVEYRSIDNRYFAKEEWEEALQTYHPLFFKREYMASFDAFSGIELDGSWLQYYESQELPRDDTGRLELTTYLGIDPAISTREDADRFAMALIGVSKQGQVYLLEQWSGQITFPEQVSKLTEWHRLYRPTYIGVEATAYQAALAQQVSRLEGLPPVLDVHAKGKKFERILSMSPLFQMGKVKIRRDHTTFIDEWINYDSSLKNPKDDCLDAVEIALRTAGVLLPEPVYEVPEATYGKTIEQLARQEIAALRESNSPFDEHLGAEF